HTINYRQTDEQGRLGTTAAANLGSVCERLHNEKTHGGWRLVQPSPGSFVWTSPTGLTYQRTASPVVPGWLT
ncbi:MAG: HNH endonuclease, partial [Actinomycetes bacterium]